jgi:hypothetical protein
MGIRKASGDARMYEWCACAEGVRKQADKPDTVDQANANVIELRRRFPTSGEQSESGRLRPPGGIDRKGLVRARDVIPSTLRALAKV